MTLSDKEKQNCGFVGGAALLGGIFGSSMTLKTLHPGFDYNVATKIGGLISLLGPWGIVIGLVLLGIAIFSKSK